MCLSRECVSQAGYAHLSTVPLSLFTYLAPEKLPMGIFFPAAILDDYDAPVLDIWYRHNVVLHPDHHAKAGATLYRRHTQSCD